MAKSGKTTKNTSAPTAAPAVARMRTRQRSTTTPPAPAKPPRTRQRKATQAKTGDVGYCRPPVDTQFKPGVSGNPKGRPKTSERYADLVMKVLNWRIPVVEGGKRRKISVHEAMLKATANKAMAGDIKAVLAIDRMIARLLPPEPPREDDVPLSETDEEILNNFFARHLKNRKTKE